MSDEKEEVRAFAEQEAAEVCHALAQHPDDTQGHNERLYDLKLATALKAAELCHADSSNEAVWQLAQALPDYTSLGLYETRPSLWGLGCAVLLGWLLGGFISAALNLFGLGGEILRPLAIFALLWAGEYLGCNPAARRILLAIFGLGALTRIAASLAAGAIRSFGALRAVLTGVSAGASFLRLAWLWFGSLLLFVFFSRKISGLNIAFFQEQLAVQIQARLNLCCFVLTRLSEASHNQPDGKDKAYCQRNDCQLAKAAISLLPDLDAPKAAWLADILTATGYEPVAQEERFLTWDPDQDQDLYDTIGLVSPGDRCLILRRPWKAGNKLERGLVQRVADPA